MDQRNNYKRYNIGDNSYCNIQQFLVSGYISKSQSYYNNAGCKLDWL